MGGVLARAARGLTRLLEVVVVVGVLALTLCVLWGVFSRYVLGNQSGWTEPLATTLLVWVSLLGGALAYADRSHLGVDFVVEKLHADARAFARVVVHLLVFVFAAVVLVGGGWALVSERLASGQVVQGLMGMPRGYVYLALPISGVFICLYAAAQFVEDAGAGESADVGDGAGDARVGGGG